MPLSEQLGRLAAADALPVPEVLAVSDSSPAFLVLPWTTGSQALPNDPCDTWVEFFAERRLHPLARLAGECGALPSGMRSALDDVADRLHDLGGPAEPPARLHGDLWAGNRMVDVRSWVIDPALAPLTVHAIKFGGGYVGAVSNALRSFL